MNQSGKHVGIKTDMEVLRKKKEEEGAPTLIMAAKAFQKSIDENENLSSKDTSNTAPSLENDLNELQKKMDSKMQTLNEISDKSDKNGPAAEILESVMGELEQRNVELKSLLGASEQSREQLENSLKEQNNELATLRANCVVVKTLEDEVNGLAQKRAEMNTEILALEAELNDHRRAEKNFIKRIEECERQKDTMDKEHRNQLMDMASRVRNVEEMIVEKNQELESSEAAIKELIFKCEQLGGSNDEIQKELDSSLNSGKHLLEVNAKLQFCKQYLEQQVDQLVKELKAQSGQNEQLKLKIANVTREKTTAEKQLKLMTQTEQNMQAELKMLTESVQTQQKQLDAFENGSMRSQVVVNEINIMKQNFKDEKAMYMKKHRKLEDHIKHLEGELKQAVQQVQDLYKEMQAKQTKLDFYQENYIEKAELVKLKTDLEIKYKLDLNTQLQRIGQLYQKEQSELVETMKSSMSNRAAAGEDNRSTASTHAHFDSRIAF